MIDLEKFKHGYQDLQAVINELDTAALQFKPKADAWSIHEIIVHLADAECQCYVRWRTFVADNPAIVMNFDERAWTESLHYHDIELEDALEILKLVRDMNYKFLKTLSNEEWQKTGTHSVRGVLTLETLMQGYAEHIDRHIAQIYRNLQAFRLSPKF